jgi:hypothetical protein
MVSVVKNQMSVNQTLIIIITILKHEIHTYETYAVQNYIECGKTLQI